MAKTALMFGSIGSVVESSDVQRRAYNQALREAGISWEWTRETYAELLAQAGGKERLAMLAAATGVSLSQAQIEKIHARKTEIACEELMQKHAALRPGVAKLIRVCKDRGMKIGFVTTTYEPNIDAIFESAASEMSKADFDAVVTRDDVKRGKPAPDAYETALKKLGVSANEAVAIEDTANSVMSAKRAGLEVVATPGEFTSGQDFWQADLVLERLTDSKGELDARILTIIGA